MGKGGEYWEMGQGECEEENGWEPVETVERGGWE